MAMRKCPSCGQRYNGKRCKNCFYEPFGEVTTSFDLHQDMELPQQEAAPSRPRVPARPGTTRTRRKSRGGGVKWVAIVWSLLMVTGVLGSVVSYIFEAVEDVGSNFLQATPESVPLPADGYVLYEDADVLILADWDGVSPIAEDVPIYVENFTGKDLVVCTDGAAINGCMTNDVFFYCDAYQNSVCRATLWVDEQTLEELGIKEIESLRLAIDIMEEDSYDILVEDYITGWGGDTQHTLDTTGVFLYEADGVTVLYQGWEVDEYGDTRLRFYVANNTESALELSSDEIFIDGQQTGAYLWQKFFPGTKAVIWGNLYDFELEQSAEAAVELYLTPDGNWENEVETGLITFGLD